MGSLDNGALNSHALAFQVETVRHETQFLASLAKHNNGFMSFVLLLNPVTLRRLIGKANAAGHDVAKQVGHHGGPSPKSKPVY